MDGGMGILLFSTGNCVLSECRRGFGAVLHPRSGPPDYKEEEEEENKLVNGCTLSLFFAFC